MNIAKNACIVLALTIGLGLGTAHAEESWFDSIKGALGLGDDAADDAGKAAGEATDAAGDVTEEAVEGATSAAESAVEGAADMAKEAGRGAVDMGKEMTKDATGMGDAAGGISKRWSKARPAWRRKVPTPQWTWART
ncbi:hypothetical protein AUC68_10930 [Methyloceanibacter methanicus]|uniref:Uncharacterized protein n=1 Tax=Methyloceanibacter methanicus TaxID=1774968 RepID=A0A1E3VWU8_9HYPH|nr:hypothetical protein [Methyloceanibacter methanicus]ODR98013.1 hypothetical protein AUC68_10930 [Methyloceanibacter methanicus]